MEAVEQGMVVWHARALPRVPRGLSAALLGSRPYPIGPITLVVKRAGTRSAGNPHATCDVAGTGNGASEVFRSCRASPRPYPAADKAEALKCAEKADPRVDLEWMRIRYERDLNIR